MFDYTDLSISADAIVHTHTCQQFSHSCGRGVTTLLSVSLSEQQLWKHMVGQLVMLTAHDQLRTAISFGEEQTDMYIS